MSENTRYLNIFIPCPVDKMEMVSAELFTIGFEGVWEQDLGLDAYVPVGDYQAETLHDVLNFYEISPDDIRVQNLDDINWNENWEKSYEAILVNDRCLIRAEFHPRPDSVEYDIVIQPKMSFGTGHHDSTRMIVELMLDMNFQKKKVLDAGCGTGVLAILAGMKGASPIDAIDNNPWSYENTQENAQRNAIPMHIELTDIESFGGNGYDVILSNITRNINHQNIPKYSRIIAPGGHLVMSGFFDHDFDFIHEQAIKHGFSLLNRVVSEKGWTALEYQR